MMFFKETGRSPGANDNLSPCNYNLTDTINSCPWNGHSNSMAEKASISAAREARSPGPQQPPVFLPMSTFALCNPYFAEQQISILKYRSDLINPLLTTP